MDTKSEEQCEEEMVERCSTVPDTQCRTETSEQCETVTNKVSNGENSSLIFAGLAKITVRYYPSDFL